MNQEQQTLAERRLSLLQNIAEHADEISRIDKRIKSIAGDRIVMDQVDHSMDGQDPDAPQNRVLPLGGQSTIQYQEVDKCQRIKR
jgi:hypothetical protein